jgi:hypothetical protein
MLKGLCQAFFLYSMKDKPVGHSFVRYFAGFDLVAEPESDKIVWSLHRRY